MAFYKLPRAIVAAIFIVLTACQPASSNIETPEPTPSQPQIQTQLPPTTSATSAEIPPGASMDEFFESSYQQLLLRDPEQVIESGLSDTYPLPGVTLTDISDSYVRETQRIQSELLDMLRQYDRQALTPEQQVSYDVYEWYLDDLVRGHEFMYYNYPVTHMQFGIDQMLILFFEDIHPVTNLQEAEEYITRLSLVDEKFSQLLEGLRLREEAGIVPPDFIVEGALSNAYTTAYASATRTPFYTALAEKLDELDELSAEQREALLADAAATIEESVIPAYQELANYLQHLVSLTSENAGLWQFPAGEEYYTYLLRHHTTTDLTADEIHNLGLQELERIHAEMRAMASELNYGQDLTIRQIYDLAARDGGYVPGGEMIETYEQVIEQANQRLTEAFDIQPQADVIVIEGPTGGFYVAGSLDGSRPGAFYATAGGGRPLYNLATLTYHETVPGHHFQIAIAQEMDLPLFRNLVSFTGYIEGWALYAERLAWELGWYDGDPYGNLGRLQYEAYRAARLVVDTGLHAKGWSFGQAVDFFAENTGFSRGAGQHEIARYAAMPGQATAYMVGMLKILELRQMAMDQLGDEFDLVEFHHVVLASGSMPLQILEQVVQQYIDAKLGS